MYKELHHILGITLFFIAVDSTANTILYFYDYNNIPITNRNDEILNLTLFDHINLINHNGYLNKNMVAVAVINNDSALISHVLIQCDKNKLPDMNICNMFKNII